MTKTKFILISILKTWLISTLVSVIFLILFMNATREVRDYPRSCDMSGLAYAFVIFWILFLSILSLSSLLSLLQQFQGKVKTVLCWFLLPVLASMYLLFFITEGRLSGEDFIFFLIMNLPWLALWSFYYYRLTVRFNKNHK